GDLHRAVRPLLPRHGRPVHGQQAEGCLMTATDLPAPGAITVPRAARALPRAWRIAGYAALILAAAALLLPFYWMILSSLKTNNDVYTIPIKWLPDPVMWDNYVRIWQKSNMTTWLRNTLLLSVVVTALQVFTGSFAAYGFARIRFPGRNALFLLYIGTIAV